MKKIVYVCPMYPFPADFGGAQGTLNHIKELAEIEDVEIYYLFINLDDKNIEPVSDFLKNKKYKVFNYRQKNRGLWGEIYKLFYVLLSIYPRLFKVTANKKVIKEIESYNPDLIILDGIQTVLTVPKKLKNKSKIIYISHNLEVSYMMSFVKVSPIYSVYKYTRFLIAIKTWFFERYLWNLADKILVISTYDYEKLEKYSGKTVLCPQTLELKKNLWKNNNSKTLLFAGNIKSPQNYDAVRWLVTELAPNLPSDVTIYISGSKDELIPLDWKQNPSIKYLGFVSDEELNKLYRNSSAFICPINVGSGIQTKILNALEYGIPIIATEHALSGLKFIDVPVLLYRNNIDMCVKNISDLLNNAAKLEDLNDKTINEVKKYQIDRHKRFDKIIKELIKE